MKQNALAKTHYKVECIRDGSVEDGDTLNVTITASVSAS